MDAQAKKKAFFRAKLNAQKQEKNRIDSPIVRYNEHDQPVCKVCEVVIKSESHWPAHQASRKHHAAIENYKAAAAELTRSKNAAPAKELSKPKPESSKELNDKPEPSSMLPVNKSSTLPPDFFDNHDSKRLKAERGSGHKNDTVPLKTQVEEAIVSIGTDGPSTTTTKMRIPELQASNHVRQASKPTTGSEAKQTKGALPEGFFDDKDADLRARGITPVKPDVKDEYKEFEKLIQEDLQEVDNRLEEEEFDAAEMIEEEETVEQRTYKERVEMLRKKKLELRDLKSVPSTKSTKSAQKESGHKDSSSDDEDDEGFRVDWRSKHL